VTLEGMLAGKPIVVTSDSGGAMELIEHGVDGLVADPTPQAIAESLDQLYSDRELAQRMGESGREKLLAMNLSWQNVVKKIISAAG